MPPLILLEKFILDDDDADGDGADDDADDDADGDGHFVSILASWLPMFVKH